MGVATGRAHPANGRPGRCCTLGGSRAQRAQFTDVKSTAHLPAVRDRLLRREFCLTAIVDLFRLKDGDERWLLSSIAQHLLQPDHPAGTAYAVRCLIYFWYPLQRDPLPLLIHQPQTPCTLSCHSKAYSLPHRADETFCKKKRDKCCISLIVRLRWILTSARKLVSASSRKVYSLEQKHCSTYWKWQTDGFSHLMHKYQSTRIHTNKYAASP